MGLTLSERLWYGVLLVLGAVCCYRSLPGFIEATARPGILLLFAVAILVGLFRQVRLSFDEYHSVYTLDDVPTFALIYTFSAGAAAVVTAFTRFVFEALRLMRALLRHPERVTVAHALFHFADVVLVMLTASLSGRAYLAVSRGEALLSGPASILGVLASAVVWFVVAFALNAFHLAVRQGRVAQAQELFFKNLMSVRLPILLLVPLGVLMAIFVQGCPQAIALLVVPVAMMHNSMEARHKLIKESRSTIRALTDYLEERDPYTCGHSERVAGYSAEVAKEMGMSSSEVSMVRRAGLIHDLGKIDVPDAVLRKPGLLTAEEREVMRTHTDRAVELGKKLVALRRGLPFDVAAYHHEHFDGGGHFGLKGKEIPLASRILAVADTFDAMTSDRPYRKGLNDKEALRRLQRASGSQLDPEAVEAFVQAYCKGRIGAVRQAWRSEHLARTAAKEVVILASGS